MSLLNGPSNGDWATFAEEVVKERDAAIAALTNIAEWVKQEQQRNANRGRGGQTTGDTHPYLPPSILQELGRMSQLSSGEYTHEYYVKMLDKINTLKATNAVLKSKPTCPHWVANDYVHDCETSWRCNKEED
jgi:hypothetical protein